MKGNSPENYIFMPGTKAYPIYLGKKDKLENCEACKGKGEIVLPDGKSYNCPACFGWGYHQEAQEEINRRNKLLREKEAIEAKINE